MHYAAFASLQILCDLISKFIYNIGLKSKLLKSEILRKKIIFNAI